MQTMKENRNIGLDLLRFLSMLGIVGLHIMNAGGARGTITGFIDKGLVSLLDSVMMSSVNVFAMITGYLYVSKKVSSRNVINLMGICAFYWIVITAVLAVFFPQLLPSARAWLESLFPPITGAYWYLVGYIFMFFLAPFVNELLRSLTKKRFRILVILLFFLLSVVPTFGLRDYFVTGWGYSPWWLITCYIVGAYIRLHGLTIKWTKSALVLDILLLYGARLLTKIIGIGIHLNSYTSPFILIEAALLLSIFEKLSIPTIMQKIIGKLSSYAFGVYVIHCHQIVYDQLIVSRFTFLGNWGVSCIFGIILFCIIVYLLCIPCEIIRIRLFKTKFVSKPLGWLGEKVDGLLYS